MCKVKEAVHSKPGANDVAVHGDGPEGGPGGRIPEDDVVFLTTIKDILTAAAGGNEDIVNGMHNAWRVLMMTRSVVAKGPSVAEGRTWCKVEGVFLDVVSTIISTMI